MLKIDLQSTVDLHKKSFDCARKASIFTFFNWILIHRKQYNDYYDITNSINELQGKVKKKEIYHANKKEYTTGIVSNCQMQSCSVPLPIQ